MPLSVSGISPSSNPLNHSTFAKRAILTCKTACFAFQNAPFHSLKRCVPQAETVLAAQRGRFCKHCLLPERHPHHGRIRPNLYTNGNGNTLPRKRRTPQQKCGQTLGKNGKNAQNITNTLTLSQITVRIDRKFAIFANVILLMATPSTAEAIRHRTYMHRHTNP